MNVCTDKLCILRTNVEQQNIISRPAFAKQKFGKQERFKRQKTVWPKMGCPYKKGLEREKPNKRDRAVTP